MSGAHAHVIAMTGATGLLGRRFASLLHGRGVALRLLVRSPGYVLPGAVAVRGDLLDAASMRELVRGADAVVHLGGVAHTTLHTAEERQRTREINVGGTVRLLEAARQEGVGRIVVASSAHVYQGQQGTNLTETSPTAGDSPYAQMKLDAEAAAHAAVASGADIVLVRPSLVYGPGVRFNLASLLRAVRRRRYLHAGGASPWRSLASVDTVAAAILHVLRHGESGATYNLADQAPVNLQTWVNGLADRMGAPHPRTVPLSLLLPVAAALTPVARLGLPVPLTLEALRKLTTSFSLDVGELRRTGFIWPDTVDAVLDEMLRDAGCFEAES